MSEPAVMPNSIGLSMLNMPESGDASSSESSSGKPTEGVPLIGGRGGLVELTQLVAEAGEVLEAGYGWFGLGRIGRWRGRWPVAGSGASAASSRGQGLEPTLERLIVRGTHCVRVTGSIIARWPPVATERPVFR